MTDFKQLFKEHKVLFATNGDEQCTPSIVWSKQTYAPLVDGNLHVVSSKTWGKSCFLETVQHAHRHHFDYVIYIDADCFICSFQKLADIFIEFKDGQFVLAGMPDGGCVPVRHHNKYIINPFFSMFNVSRCWQSIDMHADVLSKLSDEDQRRLDFVLSQSPDSTRSSSSIDSFERYYQLFSSFSHGGKTMYLTAGMLEHIAPYATAIYHGSAEEQNIVCLHAWYARNRDKANIQRIEKIFKHAQMMQDRSSHVTSTSQHLQA